MLFSNLLQAVRNIPLPQQLLAKQRSLMGVKGLQLGGKAVGGTVQIVQGGGQKQVTMQQIQQVLKQVPQPTIQHITQVRQHQQERSLHSLPLANTVKVQIFLHPAFGQIQLYESFMK